MADYTNNSQSIAVAGTINCNGVAGGLATLATIATSGTIATANQRIALCTVSAGAAITAAVLQPGTINGQGITVVNENATAASTITFAASGTSFVAQGTGAAISGLTSRRFVWDGAVWW